MSIENELTLGQIVGSILRHRLMVVSGSAIAIALSILAYKYLPRQYGSEGRVYVQVGRTNTGIDPTTTNKPISIQDTRETEIRSVMEIVKSRVVLQQVVDAIGADNILASGWTMPFDFSALTTSGAAANDDMSAEEYQLQKTRDQAIRQLQDCLNVSLEKNTSVISVFAKAQSPKLAQRIVDKLMEFGKEKHVEIHSSALSHTFFQQEFLRQEQKLADAIERQKKFRNQHGFLSVEAAKATEQMVLDKLETQLIDVDVDLEQVDQRILELEGKLSEIPELIAAEQAGKETFSTEKARSDMFALESQRAKLLATYSESHPQVQQIAAQIESLKNELAKLPAERTETVQIANKVHENIKTEYVSALAGRKGLQGRKENLLAKRSGTTDRLKVLNQLSVESQQLQRDIDVAQKHLEIYIQKQGEAQVLDELDKERISDVVVVQPAMLMVKHVNPKASIVVALGTLFGFFLSTLVAVVLDLRQRRPAENANSDRSSPELPVLVTLPRVATRRSVIR